MYISNIGQNVLYSLTAFSNSGMVIFIIIYDVLFTVSTVLSTLPPFVSLCIFVYPT